MTPVMGPPMTNTGPALLAGPAKGQPGSTSVETRGQPGSTLVKTNSTNVIHTSYILYFIYIIYIILKIGPDFVSEFVKKVKYKRRGFCCAAQWR